MEKAIQILATKNCDTRALKPGQELERDLVKKDTLAHVTAVQMCGDFMCEKIQEQFATHDNTKLGKNLDAFKAALETRTTGDDFKKNDWWKLHLSERHHLNDRCPDDVNLIDVLELICDCVSAGLARTGNVYDIEISDEILEKAVKNTAAMLIENIEVKDN